MTTNKEVVLGGLAHEIKLECLKSMKASRSSVRHAIAAGHKLIEAKDLVAHGKWGDWVREETDMSSKTSELYMRLAREKKYLMEDPQRIRDLTLNAADQLLANRGKKKGEEKKEKRFAHRLRAMKAAHQNADSKTIREYLDWINADDDRRKEFVTQYRKVFG